MYFYRPFAWCESISWGFALHFDRNSLILSCGFFFQATRVSLTTNQSKTNESNTNASIRRYTVFQCTSPAPGDSSPPIVAEQQWRSILGSCGDRGCCSPSLYYFCTISASCSESTQIFIVKTYGACFISSRCGSTICSPPSACCHIDPCSKGAGLPRSLASADPLLAQRVRSKDHDQHPSIKRRRQRTKTTKGDASENRC